ncbi:MAG: VWA domain-containing protein, partial [Eubacterium sp.]
LSNDLILLASCHSGQNRKLADSFINKGATAVLGFTDTVYTAYCCNIGIYTLAYMTWINPNTKNYYTLSEALNKAKSELGNDDIEYAKNHPNIFTDIKSEVASPIIFGDTAAEDYRLDDYVPIAVDSFTVPDSKTLTIGQIDIIEPEIAPEDATDYTIEWTSSDESVVTVNPTGEYGTLTAKSKGTATITAKLTSGSNSMTKSTEVSVASKGRDTVLVLDVSGSMSGTPLTEMKESALQFCDDLLLDEYNNRVAIVCFDDTVTYHSFSNDLSELKEYINNITDGGATNMTAALVQADEIMSEEGMDDHIKNIVIMADGLPNRGQTSLSGSAEFSSSSYLLFTSGEEYANAVVDTANEIMQNYNMYSLGFFHSLSGSDYDNCSKLMSKLTNMENGYHEVDQAENLQFEFGDIADDITDGSKIVINIACPVDVSVSYEGETLSSASDSYNDSASFGTLQLLGSKQDVKVLSLDSDKVYDVELCGTDTGTMDYSVNYINENDEITDYRNFSSIPISETTIIDSSTDNSTTVNLNIDNNGDGVVDIIWGADSNSNAEIIEDNTPTEPETTQPQTTTAATEPSPVPENNNEGNDNIFMIVIIVICSFIALGVIILLIIVGIRHKKDDKLTDELPVLTEDAVASAESIKSKENNVKSDATLEILSGSMEEMKIPVVSGEILALGKNPSLCQVVFTPDYAKVSRLHCTIMFDKNIGKFFVTDSSSNGTYFATNRKLEKGKRTAVQSGTILYLSDDNCAIRLIANSN